MAVKIVTPTAWREKMAGPSTIEVPAGNLLGVMQALAEKYPGVGGQLLDEQGELRPGVSVFINQENCRYLGGMSATVRDGDEVYIIPMVTGG